MRRYNIVFVYPTVFHPERGGVERVTDTLAKGFKERGHRVIYLNNKRDEILEDYEYPAEQYFFPNVKYDTEVNHKFYRDFLQRENIDFVINQCGCFEDSSLYCDTKGTRARSISVIHFNPRLLYDNLFIHIRKLRNKSLIENIKRVARIVIYPKIKRDYIKRLKFQFECLEKLTDEVVLLSESFKQELYSVNPNLKASVIPNPLPSMTETDVVKKENLVLWVGRFDMKQKRPDRMVKIWSRIYKYFPDWRLVMIGDGDCKNDIEKMCKGIERISFTGYVDPSPWYAKAKILCMTSTFEGFGMVLIEGMRYGVVPIAFDSYLALDDIVKEKELKVNPFDIRAYAENLKTLMRNPQRLHDLSLIVKENSNKFLLSNIIDKWEELFNIIENKK